MLKFKRQNLYLFLRSGFDLAGLGSVAHDRAVEGGWNQIGGYSLYAVAAPFGRVPTIEALGSTGTERLFRAALPARDELSRRRYGLQSAR